MEDTLSYGGYPPFAFRSKIGILFVMSTVSVFRSGKLVKAQSYCEIERWERTDAFKPTGRIGRLEGLFCAPDLDGLARWVKANSELTNYGHSEFDATAYELRIDPSNVWVYEVEAWDRACFTNSTEADMKAYWDTGISLIEWKSRGLDGRKWEALVSVEAICSSRKVSSRRLIQAIEDDLRRREMMCLLERTKWFKGFIYPYTPSKSLSLATA
jgi:hypothetical protein